MQEYHEKTAALIQSLAQDLKADPIDVLRCMCPDGPIRQEDGEAIEQCILSENIDMNHVEEGMKNE